MMELFIRYIFNDFYYKNSEIYQDFRNIKEKFYVYLYRKKIDKVKTSYFFAMAVGSKTYIEDFSK